MAQGCQHYVAGEEALAHARAALAVKHHGDAVSWAALAAAEFAGAQAAFVGRGAHGDPALDIRTEGDQR